MKWIKSVVIVLIVSVLAIGTIVESRSGHAISTDKVYGTWWFTTLMIGAALLSISEILRGRLWHKPYKLLIYSAVVIILVGGGLTTWTGQRGVMTLYPNIESNIIYVDGDEEKLPFLLTLTSFEVANYVGTQSPMDFISQVAIDDNTYTISMNHILRHRNYRFYQHDFGDNGSSTLLVTHDPYGIATTYAGYILMLLGLLLMLFSKDGAYRRLIRGVPIIALLLFFSIDTSAKPTTLPRETADQFGRMYVLYNGRVCPMQSLAKDFTTKLTGKSTYQGLTSEQVLTGFLFYFQEWANEPLIKIKGDSVQMLAHIKGRRASFNDLVFLNGIEQRPTTDKNIKAANEKYNLIRMLISGKMLKIYPIIDSCNGIGWYAQNDVLPMSVSDDEYMFIRKSLGYCQELVVSNDFNSLNTVFDKTLQYQQRKADSLLPSAARIRAERIFNSLSSGKWTAMASVTLGLVMFIIGIISLTRKKRTPRSVRLVGIVWTIFLTIYLLAIYITRWIAGNHIPMAGSYDSMTLMAIVIGVLAICLNKKHDMLLPSGMMTMGFCLLVAMLSGSNPSVTNLMPVLASPLLAMHVSVIMVSYALFFFVMMCCIAGLVLSRQREIVLSLQHVALLLLYPAVVLLSVGVMIGALWANVSWGNYWAWDPKEVWALITLIVYSIALTPTMRREKNTALFNIYCILAFLSVLITYFGVNMLLGGMHAYN